MTPIEDKARGRVRDRVPFIVTFRQTVKAVTNCHPGTVARPLHELR
jgi:hypothetical protein